MLINLLGKPLRPYGLNNFGNKPQRQLLNPLKYLDSQFRTQLQTIIKKLKQRPKTFLISLQLNIRLNFNVNIIIIFYFIHKELLITIELIVDCLENQVEEVLFYLLQVGWGRLAFPWGLEGFLGQGFGLELGDVLGLFGSQDCQDCCQGLRLGWVVLQEDAHALEGAEFGDFKEYALRQLLRDRLRDRVEVYLVWRGVFC